MKTVGIIAEYNPFHTGHAYHILKAKELTGADCAIIAMSGDFVQRGEPAIMDKYIRAKAALLGGADIIFELPAAYATASAEIFAEAGIKLFNALNCVDYLAFGCEDDNIDAFMRIASVLTNEPDGYSRALSSALKGGLSFPAARVRALSGFLSDADLALLDTPNNILAVEYCKALLRTGSAIKPIAVKRIGSSYNSSCLPDSAASFHAGGNTDTYACDWADTYACAKADTYVGAKADTYVGAKADTYACDRADTYACATAVRKVLASKDTDSIQPFVPSESFELYKASLGVKMPLRPDDFSDMLFNSLNRPICSNLTDIADVGSDLANRLSRFIGLPVVFEELAQALQTKNITRTAINRALLHIMLSTPAAFTADLKDSQFLPYARLLGFRRDASSLLRTISDAGSIELITKLADADTDNPLLQHDIFCAACYNQAISTKFCHRSASEFETSPIIL